MVTIGTVTGQEVRKNRDGFADVRLLQVRMTNDTDIQTVQYMPTSGDDSPPQIDDLVVILSLGTAFRVAVGVQDSVTPIAAPGERRLYSRDGDGDLAAVIALLANGNMELNGNADSAVRHAALNTALQGLVTAINSVLATKLNGAGAAGLLTLDLSAAESPTVKLA